MGFWLTMNLKQRVSQLKSDIGAVYFALRHRDTPWYAKVVAGITVAYALSPVDLIPDFIPVLGYLDDVVVLGLLLILVIKLIPNTVMKQCRERAKDLWQGTAAKRWVYALPIIAIWLILLFFIVKAIYKLLTEQ